ncbi:hypothetical protein D3C77_696460 [compost metagenome]
MPGKRFGQIQYAILVTLQVIATHFLQCLALHLIDQPSQALFCALHGLLPCLAQRYCLL